MKKKSVAIITILALLIIIIIVISLSLTRNNNSDNESIQLKTITISVYNQDNTNLFYETIETDKDNLIDILTNISELQLKTEDSQYGAYITSIMGIEQSDEYYWSYYIDDTYATIGVSSCKIEDGKNYSFRFEAIQY